MHTPPPTTGDHVRSTSRIAAALSALALVTTACGTGGDVETAEPTGEAVAASEPSTSSEPATGRDAASEPATASEAPADSAASTVLASAATQAEGQSARTRFSSTTSTPQGDVEVSGEGVTGADGTARITMTIGGQAAQAMGGDGDVELEVVLLDGVMYQRFPLLTDRFGTDEDWLSFDLATLGPEFADLLQQARSADPSQALSVLQQAGEVTEAGSEELDGVETTRYEAVVQYEDLLAAQGMSMEGLGPAGSELDIDQIPMTVWVDGDGLVRQLETSLDVDGTTTSSTIEILEYGVEVDVSAPSADDTVPIEELLQRPTPEPSS